MLTAGEAVGLVAACGAVLSVPTVLTVAARKLRARRRRSAPFLRDPQVQFRPGISAVPDRFTPFDWDDDEQAVIEGEILRDHAHDTVFMRALDLADRECDDTRIVPVQRGRGGVR